MSQQRLAKKLGDHQGYAEAKRRLVELQLDKERLDREIGELEQRVQAASGPFSDHARREFDAKVEAKLTRSAVSAGPSLAQLREDLGSKYAEREITSEAIVRQGTVVEEQRTAASDEICRGLAPEWRKIVAQIGAAVSQLQAALKAEAAFRQGLLSDRVQLRHPIRFAGLGAGDDTVEFFVEQWLKEFGDLV